MSITIAKRACGKGAVEGAAPAGIPLPYLARLPVVATGTPSTKEPKSDGEEFRLPAELWTKIVALTADDDACDKLDELCKKQHLATWLPSCEDGSLHDELNARFGWYGDLSSMADVLREHGESLSKAAKIPKDGLNTKTYFKFMCSSQYWLKRSFDDLARTPEGKKLHKSVLRKVISKELEGPLDAPWVTALAKYVVDLDPQLLMLVPGSFVPSIIAENLDLPYPIDVVRALEGTTATRLVPNSEGRIAGYAEVAMAAVTKDGSSLRYVPGALDDNPYALARVDTAPVPNFAELATIAVRTTPRCLKYVPLDHPKWTEIAKAAVRANAINLVDVPETHADYDEILGVANRAEVSRLAQQIGVGLSEADHEKLFRALRRLAAQQQRETGGGGAS